MNFNVENVISKLLLFEVDLYKRGWAWGMNGSKSISELFLIYIAHESIHLVTVLDYNLLLNIFMFTLWAT